VVRLVASTTDDEEMIAAAWLHDVVEDTPATLEDVRREFGASVAVLVQDLTDVSRPSDGNRAARKEVDRRHLALASPRAKTIKVADLIDNCEDITRNDPRFARVFLQEMDALLGVLGEGDAGLLQRGRRASLASASTASCRATCVCRTPRTSATARQDCACSPFRPTRSWTPMRH
jgi:hypothetical protein